jgi:hypothetical protein
MQHPEETYIVRVRREDGDAIVEEVRSRKRVHVHELTQLGELIAAWVGYESPPPEPAGGAMPGIPE